MERHCICIFNVPNFQLHVSLRHTHTCVASSCRLSDTQFCTGLRPKFGSISLVYYGPVHFNIHTYCLCTRSIFSQFRTERHWRPLSWLLLVMSPPPYRICLSKGRLPILFRSRYWNWLWMRLHHFWSSFSVTQNLLAMLMCTAGRRNSRILLQYLQI